MATREYEFTTEELKIMGEKMKSLIRKANTTQTIVGINAFGLSKEQGQQYMRRLLNAEKRSICWDDYDIILNYIGRTREDLKNEDIGGMTLKEFDKGLIDDLWPDYSKYEELYKTAIKTGNDDIIENIKKGASENLKKHLIKKEH